MVTMTGTASPFSHVGVYRHWRTAVIAACVEQRDAPHDPGVVDDAVRIDGRLEDDDATDLGVDRHLRILRLHVEQLAGWR